MIKNTFLRSYALSLVLIGAIVVGSLVGLVFPTATTNFPIQWHDTSFNTWLLTSVIKPFGDVFLNALFTVVVPLVFFSISSAVAGMVSTKRLFRILGWMMVVFIITGVIASLLMVAGVKLFPPAEGVHLTVQAGAAVQKMSTSDQIVSAVSTSDFVNLLSKRNMLALIVFAVLVGLAASAAGEKGRPFANFLASGSEVFMKVISLIMYYAPLGLAAYFAYLVGVFGPDLLTDYARAMALYYPLCIAYFFIAFTLYSGLAGGGLGVRRFWGNIVPASLTAMGTGSSFATIPVSLQAADRIGTPREVSEVVIPIGATIHMDGSCLAAVLKIAFLFGIYQMPFQGFETIAIAVGIAILSGTVMSGIPQGGFTGEILIVAMYGFPPEALPIISMIGTLVDPPATMVNAVGDNVASMLVARLMGGKGWMQAGNAPQADANVCCVRAAANDEEAANSRTAEQGMSNTEVNGNAPQADANVCCVRAVANGEEAANSRTAEQGMSNAEVKDK